MNRRHLARITSGVVAALVLAGAAGYAAAVPWPTVGPTGPGESAVAPRVDVTPVAAEAVLACDGPLVALGRNAENAEELSHVSDLAFTARNGMAEEPASEPRLELEGIGSALTVSQLPVDGESVAVAAAGSASVEAPDLRGSVASACRPGSPESWITGATVQTGVTDILMLANPSDVVATVSLAVYGVEGRSAPAGGDIALSPQSQQAIPVAGIADGEQSPVIRVTARGAPVRATLQSSRVETLDPMGIDLQPGTLPARESVIPGVHVTSTAAGADDPTFVRLLATRDGAVEVDVVSEETGASVFSTTADLTADVPVTVGFDALKEGTYSVRLTGDTRFVAAVRQAAADDYAWLTPEEPLTGSSLVAVPDSPTGEYTLSLAALGGEAATVRYERVSGSDPHTVEVAAGGSSSVAVADDTTYRVTVEAGRVSGSVGVAVDGAIASFSLAPDPAAPETITVTP